MAVDGPYEMARLQRSDPARNMARFYRVELVPTLFGEVSVRRIWGRIGTRGQSRVETFATASAARHSAAQCLRAKLRGGYARS